MRSTQMRDTKIKKNNLYPEFIFLSLSIIALLGLIFNKDLFLLWGVVLGISFSGLIYRFIKVNKSTKLVASFIAFFIGFSFAFLSASVSGDNVAKGDFIEFSSQSSSVSSSNNFEVVSNNNSINYLYDVSPDSPTNQDIDTVISNTNIELKGVKDSTKNIKSFRVLDVFSPTTISLEGLGLVQLLGLQNPNHNTLTECLEESSKSKLEDIIKGKNVYLEFDSSARYDRFGRVLAYVYLQSDYFVNLQMISDGLAYSLDNGVSDHYKYNEFKSMESQAKLIPTGVWVEGVCNQEESAQSFSSSSRVFSQQNTTQITVVNQQNNTNTSKSSSSSTQISTVKSQSSSSSSSSISKSSSSSSSSTISQSSSSSSNSVISSSSSSSSSSSKVLIGRFWGGYIDGYFVCRTSKVPEMTTPRNFDTLSECETFAGGYNG